MRTRSSVQTGALRLALVMPGLVCLSIGCGAGEPTAISRAVETPEQVLRRERAIRDAVLKGAYGKHAQRAALKRSRGRMRSRVGTRGERAVHAP